MTDKNDIIDMQEKWEAHGFAAFPYTPYGDDDQRYHEHGMSLRDWFAGRVITSGRGATGTAKEIAEWAYMVADAMLEQRGK